MVATKEQAENVTNLSRWPTHKVDRRAIGSVVRSAAVPRIAVRAGALAAVVSLSLLAATAGAGSPGAGRTERLSTEADALARQARGAVLELYAVQSGLVRARTRLAQLHTATARVQSRREVVRRELAATQRSLKTSQQLVAARLKTLYEQGEVDPLAVVLGSSSLDQALERIDALDRLTRQSEAVVEQASRARRTLHRLSRSLAATSTELGSLVRNTEQTASALAAGRVQRVSLIASLRTRERLDRNAVARLEASARAANARAAELAVVAPAPVPSPSVSAAATTTVTTGPGALTVVATGYSMHGRTATGVPTGWGVAAVDPSLIPLGTRFAVPGYGEAVAADIGSSIHGAVIDLWFPTLARARAWGRRSITITIR
jgi:3D (Asp-Asp-Asp) domain-containing protein